MPNDRAVGHSPASGKAVDPTDNDPCWGPAVYDESISGTGAVRCTRWESALAWCRLEARRYELIRGEKFFCDQSHSSVLPNHMGSSFTKERHPPVGLSSAAFHRTMAYEIQKTSSCGLRNPHD